MKLITQTFIPVPHGSLRLAGGKNWPTYVGCFKNWDHFWSIVLHIWKARGWKMGLKRSKLRSSNSVCWLSSDCNSASSIWIAIGALFTSWAVSQTIRDERAMVSNISKSAIKLTEKQYADFGIGLWLLRLGKLVLVTSFSSSCLDHKHNLDLKALTCPSSVVMSWLLPCSLMFSLFKCTSKRNARSRKETSPLWVT